MMDSRTKSFHLTLSFKEFKQPGLEALPVAAATGKISPFRRFSHPGSPNTA